MIRALWYAPHPQDVTHDADDHAGPWTAEEVIHLDQVMQAMEEEGKTPTRTPKFWKAILEHMDGTWMCDQCRDKWKVKDRRIQWCETDTKTLINKYVCQTLSDLC